MTYNYTDNKTEQNIIGIMRFLSQHIVAEDIGMLEGYIRVFCCPKTAFRACGGVREYAKCRKCWGEDDWI